MASRGLEGIHGQGGHPGVGRASRVWEGIQGLGGHTGSGRAYRVWEGIQGLGGHPGAWRASKMLGPSDIQLSGSETLMETDLSQGHTKQL